MDFAKLVPVNHSYKPGWIIQAFTYLFNVCSIAFPIFFVPLFIWIDIKNVDENLVVLLMLQLICLVITPLSFLTAAYWYTEIVSDTDGLHITFFWRHIIIRWEDIVEVKPIVYPLYKRMTFAIRARSITPFHRVYGLLYSFTILPSLIYHKAISNQDILEQRVNAAIRQNRKAAK